MRLLLPFSKKKEPSAMPFSVVPDDSRKGLKFSRRKLFRPTAILSFLFLERVPPSEMISPSFDNWNPETVTTEESITTWLPGLMLHASLFNTRLVESRDRLKRRG